MTTTLPQTARDSEESGKERNDGRNIRRNTRKERTEQKDKKGCSCPLHIYDENLSPYNNTNINVSKFEEFTFHHYLKLNTVPKLSQT